METIPSWMADLEDEDVAFIKKFILASGSLKEVAGLYGVSYPTVRLRLDRADPEDQAGRDGGGGPLCVPGEAAGGGRQAGLRHRQDPDYGVPEGEGGGLM